MVKGLDSFRSYFAGFEDCYVLIGGTACDLNFASAALPFRATRDLDIVLCVEALTPDFSRQFWRFVAEGGYKRREKSSGNRRFYRFSHPLNADFPMLLELFSRKPDFIPEDYDGIIAPIPMGEEASSLSAILLDDTYYRFIFDNRLLEDGVSFVSPVALIVLKAVAWLDLTAKRESGDATVSARDVSKHKNDIARLVGLSAGQEPTIPPSIGATMAGFMERYAQESIDVASLGLGMTQAQILAELHRLFKQEGGDRSASTPPMSSSSAGLRCSNAGTRTYSSTYQNPGTR